MHGICRALMALMALGLMLTVVPGQAADDNSKWLEPMRSELMAHPGQLPFYPHRANTTGNEVLAGTSFDSAEVCGTCHQDIYRQWKGSAMAQAWEDPVYRALLARASEATGGALDTFCTGCHSPVGLTTGLISSEVNRASPEETARTHPMPGVDCESCHNISARTGLDNGAYLLQPRAHEGRPTKFGPRENAVSPYHDTQYSALHTQSDFCGVCHNVTHPFNGVPIERTYDEWLESEYAQNGETCQSCHMAPTRGRAAIMGPERSDIASHAFPGANVTLANHFDNAESAELSRALLRNAADIRILDRPQVLRAGQLARFVVEVHNKGAGHKLPTGFPEGREVWIDFEVRDARGAVVYRLGAVRDGRTEPGTRSFRVHLGDKDGHEVEYAVWTVTHVISDNRILPNGHAHEEFAFVLPGDVKLPLRVYATLNYWPLSQALVDELLGPDKLPVEISTMAQASVVVDGVVPADGWRGWWNQAQRWMGSAR